MDVIIRAYEYLRPGGIIVVPIILISILMWTLIIERVLYLKRQMQGDLDLKEAVEMVKGKKMHYLNSKGLRFRVVKGFLAERTGKRKLDQSILYLSAKREFPHLRRHLSIIGALAAISPLLGLLGTVMGMITTFNVISQFGTGNAKALAGGISEALITTQTGLLVAIPGVYMSNFLNQQAKLLKNRLNELIMTLKRYI